MSSIARFRALVATCPLIAIIRGVTPEEAVAIGEAIVSAGIRIIEVPLNSPRPLESIRALAGALADRALVGAGTVLDAAAVARVAEAGGQLIVAPNSDPAVISASVSAGLVAAPGYFTPTEALTALAAGAQALKFFPAEAANPKVLKAQRAVLPRDVPIIVVGGVAPADMAAWRTAGADGFGLGSGLYVPGRSAEDVHRRALAYVEAVRA